MSCPECGEPTSDDDVRQNIDKYLIELGNNMPNIMGISVTVVTIDGGVRTFNAFGLGAKFPLLGGIELCKYNLLKIIESQP